MEPDTEVQPAKNLSQVVESIKLHYGELENELKFLYRSGLDDEDNAKSFRRDLILMRNLRIIRNRIETGFYKTRRDIKKLRRLLLDNAIEAFDSTFANGPQSTYAY